MPISENTQTFGPESEYKNVTPRYVKTKRFMTRELALTMADGLQDRFMDRHNADIKTLKVAMKKWLTRPVIRVLDEDLKNKIYTWCLAFYREDNEILDGISVAVEDLVEYEYTEEMEVTAFLEQPRVQHLINLIVHEDPYSSDTKQLLQYVQARYTIDEQDVISSEALERKLKYETAGNEVMTSHSEHHDDSVVDSNTTVGGPSTV